MRVTIPILIATLLVGCGIERHTRTPAPAPPSPWSVASTTPPPEGIYLSNGLIGLKAGPLGDGSAESGTPQPLFRSDRYSGPNIAPQPNPFLIRFMANGRPVRPEFERPYRQVLSLQDGVLTTEYAWRAGRLRGSVRTVFFLSRAVPEQGCVQYEVRVEGSCSFRAAISPAGEKGIVESVLERDRQQVVCRYDTPDGSPSIWSSHAEARGGTGKLAFDGERWLWQGRLRKGDVLVIEHSVRYSRNKELAKPALFEEALQASRRAWRELWRGDIRIEGNVADQQLVRSWLFNLYQTTGASFFPPMGFSSDWYGGRIFWDQEIWMLPALLPFHPEVVKEALSLRIALLPKAMANAKNKGFRGALYPWESTPWGEEGAPPEFQNEIHITGDVLFAARQALDWGISLQGYADLAKGVAEFWSSRIQDGHIRKVISPDEGDFVDDDLFTNSLAAWCLREAARFDHARGANWRKLADGIHLPRDADGTFLTYANDPVVAYKQAAALLVLYPLDMPMETSLRERMFDKYKDKVIEVGPAMADAIHAVIAARLGRREEAASFFRKSYELFLRNPGLQFSEKRKGTPRTYFLTGAGGCLQAVLYGFAGLQLLPPGLAAKTEGPGPTATKELSGGYVLRVSPCLPREWRSLTLQGVRIRGKTLEIHLTHDGAKITEGG